MIRIIITGRPGSGTTTLALGLSSALDIPYLSAGTIFRRIAEKRRITIEELGHLADIDPQFDRSLDARVKIELERTGSAVVETRIASLYPEATLRVRLVAPLACRARRVLARSGETEEEMVLREQHERTRYLENYKIDVEDPNLYDMILATDRLSADQCRAVVLAAIEIRQCAENCTRRRPRPPANVPEIDDDDRRFV